MCGQSDPGQEGDEPFLYSFSTGLGAHLWPKFVYWTLLCRVWLGRNGEVCTLPSLNSSPCFSPAKVCGREKFTRRVKYCVQKTWLADNVCLLCANLFSPLHQTRTENLLSSLVCLSWSFIMSFPWPSSCCRFEFVPFTSFRRFLTLSWS